MVTVHHLNNSRSQRVLWLLEELGVEYDVVRYQRDPKTMFAPASLRAVHPLGKSPVITDGATTVAESGAILEYLVDRYGNGRLIPARESPDRLRYTYWLHYAEGSAMPLLVMKLVFRRLPMGVPALIRPVARAISKGATTRFIDPQLAVHVKAMESELAKSTWFAGADFTAADIQMSFVVEAVAARGGEAPPGLAAFLARIHARPAYARALERGGPFELAR